MSYFASYSKVCLSSDYKIGVFSLFFFFLLVFFFKEENMFAYLYPLRQLASRHNCQNLNLVLVSCLSHDCCCCCGVLEGRTRARDRHFRPHLVVHKEEKEEVEGKVKKEEEKKEEKEEEEEEGEKEEENNQKRGREEEKELLLKVSFTEPYVAEGKMCILYKFSLILMMA